MVMVVEQNQLFVLGVSKGGDVKGSMGVHQDDLVMGQGRGLTEGRQGIEAARTEGHVGFVMEQESQFFLEVSSFANSVVFWVLVHSGFGSDEGSSTTEFISIVNSDDALFLTRQ